MRISDFAADYYYVVTGTGKRRTNTGNALVIVEIVSNGKNEFFCPAHAAAIQAILTVRIEKIDVSKPNIQIFMYLCRLIENNKI